jgi:hypothetical protein
MGLELYWVDLVVLVERQLPVAMSEGVVYVSLLARVMETLPQVQLDLLDHKSQSQVPTQPTMEAVVVQELA